MTVLGDCLAAFMILVLFYVLYRDVPHYIQYHHVKSGDVRRVGEKRI